MIAHIAHAILVLAGVVSQVGGCVLIRRLARWIGN